MSRRPANRSDSPPRERRSSSRVSRPGDSDTTQSNVPKVTSRARVGTAKPPVPLFDKKPVKRGAGRQIVQESNKSEDAQEAGVEDEEYLNLPSQNPSTGSSIENPTSPTGVESLPRVEIDSSKPEDLESASDNPALREF